MRLCFAFFSLALCVIFAFNTADLNQARNQQDGAALDRLIAQYQGTAQGNPKSAEGQYRAALAYSYGSEVAMEVRDKKKAQNLAVSGMEFANKAIALDRSNAEYHRVLGQLCAEVIPANPLFGLKYGQCAREEVDKAIQLNGKLALAYVSRGVGNSYLPPSFGGGTDLALKDFDKAVSLNPNLAEAYLWKGITLRKANRNKEARLALEKALQIEPSRLWAKQQLEKTPAQ